MNFKKFITLIVFFVAMAGTAFAQQTFFVNNLTGNDANSGTAVGQAKATVNSAMIAAPAGSFISVANTTVNYTELAPTVRGAYTFVSTGGAPVFTNAFNVGVSGYVGTILTITAGANGVVTTTAFSGVKNGDQVYIDNTGVAAYDKKYFTVSSVTGNTFVINSVAANPGAAAGNVAARGDVTFTGPFVFNAGMNLNVGTVTGGDQVTVLAQVTRTELASVTSGGFVYSGNVNLVYQNRFTSTLVTVTTGLEWVVATIANAVTTQNIGGGGITLKLDNNRTMKNILTTVGNFDLNNFLFTINGDNAHTIGGNVIEGVTTGVGTLKFAMAVAGASITGPWALPNVIVDETAATAPTLTFATNITGTGNLTVNNDALLVAQVNGNSGNIQVNGTGLVRWIGQTATSAVGTITTAVASTSNVQLENSAPNPMTTKTITHNGTGLISFPTNVNTVNVGTTGTSTNVVLNTTVPAFIVDTVPSTLPAVVNKGRIYFPDAPVTVWGQVQNNAIFSGTTDFAGNNNNGLIRFQSTASLVTIKSTVLSNITGSFSYTGAGAGTGNGNIEFATTGGNLVFAGVTNQSTATVEAGNALIISTGASAGTLTFTNMLCTSTDVDANIDFTSVSGAIGGTTVSSTGTTTGGDVKLGNGSVTLTGDVINSRGATGADVVFGTVGSGASFSGKNINNSGKSKITFNSVSGVGIVTLGTSAITQSGTGTIEFLGQNTLVPVPSGAFTFGAFTVSDGTVNFGNGIGNVTPTGVIALTKGAVSFGTGARTVLFTNATIGIGGLGTKVTFTGNLTRLDIGQPVPNVNQTITLGTLDNTWPGYITVSNPAIIPAPYVYFKSIGGTDQAFPGLLYILNTGVGSANGLLFDNTNPAVVNIVQLDNARLFVGKNNPSGSNGGGFQNTSGYLTLNGGFIMMSGGTGGTQVVNGVAANAGATFGNFGSDNNSGTTPAVSFGFPSSMTGDFYLAEGQVNPFNLLFPNAAQPYTTIYRTEGTFSSPILPAMITSFINVTYYGADKNTSNEVPTSKLWNLSVITSNGAKPGYGIISMSGAITVNGTLTINANQALYTNANALTIAGASAVINGYLVDDGGSRVTLGAASGTVFTGAGFLPTLIVGNGSLGNSVTGYTGVYSQGFGTDGIWGGVGGAIDDFINADGNLLYATGADTGSNLTVGFTGAGPHFSNLTLGVAPVTTTGMETFTISAPTVMGGNIWQGDGVIALGDNTLTHNGTGFTMSTDNVTVGATLSAITSNAAGKLLFPTNGTTLTTLISPATIAANVEFAAGTVTKTFTLPTYVAGGPDMLTINGNVTLSNGTAGSAVVAIGGGNTLTLGGSTVTVGSGSLFSAPGAGTGVLQLNNAVPNTLLTFSSPAATSVANLTVSDNVTLAGSVAGTTGVLTVGTAFIHNAGLFTFGTANLQINGTFTRNGGTYAGDGWLIYNGLPAGFQHSALVAAGAMNINNFKLTANMTLQTERNFNVIKGLWLIGGSLTNQVVAAGAGFTFVGDATTVPMITVDDGSDVLVNALQFNNANADYTFTGTSNTVSVRVWPAAPSNVARDVVVNKANVNGAIAPATLFQNSVTLGASRNIVRDLTLTRGYVIWDSPLVLAMPTVGSVITRNWTGALNYDANGNLTTGTFTVANANLVYTGAFYAEGQSPAGITPAGTGTTSGIEYSLPVVVTNLTCGATATANNIILNSARTVAGTVSLINAGTVLTLNQNTTFSAAQTLTVGTIAVTPPRVLTLGAASTLPTVTGNVTTSFPLTLAGGHAAGTLTLGDNFTVGSAAVLAASSNLAFVGATNATFTVPTAGATVGGIVFNKTTGTVYKVTLAGGNVASLGVVTFTNGLFIVPDPLVFNILAPLLAGGQGFTHVVAATDLSHVVGQLSKNLRNTTGFLAGATEPRSEFPVGSLTRYRPVAITFPSQFGVPTVPNTTVLVSHIDSSPTGAVELPIKNGIANGIDIARYPAFYWNIKTAPTSVSNIFFDLELGATGFADYDDINNVRIIRRHGTNIAADQSNQWLFQGDQAAMLAGTLVYDNELNNGIPSIINRNSNAGLRSGGAIFTLGLKSNMSIKTPIGKQWLSTSVGARTISLANTFQGNLGTLSFLATSSNNAVATAQIIGTSVKLTPIAANGQTAFVTITAIDAANNDFFAYTFEVDSRTTDVDAVEEIPTEFALMQNFPNPFNPTTNIKFALPTESNVTLKIYNILGEEVANLINQVMPAGYHTYNFDATRLSSGMYIYRIEAGSFVQVKKMLLMK